MNTIFDQGDWDSFNDVIAELLYTRKHLQGLDKYYTKECMAIMFNLLPKHIKSDAYVWGMGDTVFRDNACEWLEDNWASVENIMKVEKVLGLNLGEGHA